jgi:hypothetical protein
MYEVAAVWWDGVPRARTYATEDEAVAAAVRIGGDVRVRGPDGDLRWFRDGRELYGDEAAVEFLKWPADDVPGHPDREGEPPRRDALGRQPRDAGVDPSRAVVTDVAVSGSGSRRPLRCK